MIFRFAKASRYNSAVIACTKRLALRYFKGRSFFQIERSSADYLNRHDSITYTEFFRDRKISVEAAAIHYFDFGITQLKRLLQMSHQQDVADLVGEMERGLDQMLLDHLNTVVPDNGKMSEALSAFISNLDRAKSRHAEGI